MALPASHRAAEDAPSQTSSTAPADVAAPAPVGGGRKGAVIVGMLFIFMVINFADKAVLGLAATAISEDFDLTPGQYGTIASSFFLFFSISAFGVGYLADRFSPKRVLTALMILWAVTMLPVLGPAGFAVLLLSRIGLGFAEGPAFGIANHAAMSWYDDRKRNLPAALLGGGAPMGVIVAAPVLSWVIISQGWRAAFVVLIAASIIWAIAWAFIGEDGPVGVTATIDSASANKTPSTRVPLGRILLSRTAIGCALSAFGAYWALALIVAWIPPYLEVGLGYSRSDTGFLTTLPWVMMSVLGLGVGVGVQKLMNAGVSGRVARGYIPGAVVLTGGLCVLAAVSVSSPVLSLLLLSVGFGIPASCLTTGVTALSQITPAYRRGAVLGAFVGFYSIAGVISPYLTGRLVGKAGDVALDGYNLAFLITAVVLITGGIAAVLLIRPEPDRKRLDAYVQY